MIVYIIQFILVVLLAFIYQYANKDYTNKIIFTIFVLITVLVGGFRDELGADYYGYLMSEYYAFGVAYKFISTTINLINLPGVYIFVIYSFITYFFLFLFIKEYDNRVIYLMVAIYFALPHYYFQSYNLVRQMAGVSIFAYAISIKENIFRQFVLILFSFLLHSSVIFCLPFVLLFYKINNFKYDYIFYIISFIFVLFPNYSDELFLLFENMKIFHYNIYIQEVAAGERFAESPFGTIYYINILLTFLILFKKKVFYEMHLEKLYNFFILGQVLNNIFLYQTVLIRISYYFIINYIVIVPYLTVVYRFRYMALLRFLMLAMFATFLVISLTTSSNPFVPYKSYLFK